MDNLKQELEVYENHRSKFEEEHDMQWVVICGNEIGGFFDDFQTAAASAVSRFGRGPYLIKQIGAQEDKIPLSLFTRPMYA